MVQKGIVLNSRVLKHGKPQFDGKVHGGALSRQFFGVRRGGTGKSTN